MALLDALPAKILFIHQNFHGNFFSPHYFAFNLGSSSHYEHLFIISYFLAQHAHNSRELEKSRESLEKF